MFLKKCRCLRLAFVTIVTGVSSSICWGWNDTGHMLTALRAWDAMTPAQRAWATDLLKQHPRYDQDLASKIPPELKGEDRDHWLFAYAATWPDNLYKVRLTAPRAFQTYWHPTWHVAGIPLPIAEDTLPQGLPPASPATAPTTQPSAHLSAREALPLMMTSLANGQLPAADRAVALCWVEHLIGDIHQPCHAASLVSRRFPAPDGDHVATRLHVVTPNGNLGLHFLWDHSMGEETDLPGLETSDRDTADDAALQPDSMPQLASHTTVDSWILESHLLAAEFVYTPDLRSQIAAQDLNPKAPMTPLIVNGTYLQVAHEVARNRIALEDCGWRESSRLVFISRKRKRHASPHQLCVRCPLGGYLCGI